MAKFRQPDDNSTVGCFALYKSSILHACQLVRETAFFPLHHLGEFLLAHFAVAESNEARENTELRPGKPGCFRNVSAHPPPNLFAHVLKGTPNTEFLRGQRFSGHANVQIIKEIVDMTTKTDNLVDVSTRCQPFSLAKDTITRTKALHELISDAGRIAVLPPPSTSLAILRTQGVRNEAS